MDNITEEERKIIEELKSRTINDMTSKLLEDKSLFYRFAKARDFNLAQAEAMLRKHIVWRKEMEVDTILTNYQPPEVLVKFNPVSLAGFDKEGCAVLVHDCGRVDIKGFMNATEKREILKYMVYFMEKIKVILIKRGKNDILLGKPILSTIYDFEQLTYLKAVNVKALQVIIAIVESFLNNYPESLRTLTLINAPSYFSWMHATLKPLLPPAIIQKLRIFGPDGWKEALLENIEADELPAYLGGNKTDPDGNPLCETFIIRGQLIPKSYYTKNRKKFGLESDAEMLTVMPFSKQEITFIVKEENSYLEWEFETRNREIGFSLIFKEEFPKDEEPVELIPKQRINTYYESEKGCFKCENLGTYIIVFDNSYSWIRSKEVYYKAGINSIRSNKLYDSTSISEDKI